MDVIVTLFIVGVILIAVEVFVPGGIIGVIGVTALVGGIIVAYFEYGSGGALMAGLAAGGLVMIALVIEFAVLPKTPLGKRLFLRKKIKGATEYSHAGNLETGVEGKAATALAPTGLVLIAGKKYEAASRSGFIEKNETVKVVEKDNFRLIVSKL